MSTTRKIQDITTAQVRKVQELAAAGGYPKDDFSQVENGGVAGQYLSRFWQPIAQAKDHAPGKARRIKMLGNFYTIYRGEEGTIRLVQDRCPHRGTSLAFGWVEGGSIRCRYHGWKFSGDGLGEDFPAETATYARSICLKTYPVREYLGVIFAYFGEGDAPEFPRYPELEDENAGQLFSLAVILPYNYFQRVENDIDEVHVHYTHGEFFGSFGMTEIPTISAKESEYGILCTATRPDGTELYTHEFMPNMMLREVALPQDRTQLTIHASWRVPIDDMTTLSITIDRIGNPDKEMHAKLENMEDPNIIVARIMQGEMSLDDVPDDHPTLPVIQDTVCMAGQGIVTNRAAEHLGRSDRAIGLLRRLWKRELEALRKGEPLKQWHRADADQKLPMIGTAVKVAGELKAESLS